MTGTTDRKQYGSILLTSCFCSSLIVDITQEVGRLWANVESTRAELAPRKRFAFRSKANGKAKERDTRRGCGVIPVPEERLAKKGVDETADGKCSLLFELLVKGCGRAPHSLSNPCWGLLHMQLDRFLSR